MTPERVIRIRPRTVLVVVGVVLATVALLELLWLARQVITWILIAVFLALALDPLVEWLQRRIARRRVLAVALTYVIVLIALSALGGTFVPIVAGEVRDFVDALPDYVEEITEGRGRLGFLESEYQITDRVREAVQGDAIGRVVGAGGTAVAVTKSVLTAIVALITIAVLTFFMLLEGPTWIERAFSLLAEERRERWRNVGRQVYRTVGGYVTGALTIALIAGVVSAVLLSILDVEYAIALGLLVALLDLIPLAGATIATVVISTIAFLDTTPKGIAVLVFFVLYQQVENHFLYPLVYSRTVQLSPLAILVAVLVGASLAGILGALAAIPVAGTIQVLVVDWIKHREEAAAPAAEAAEPAELSSA